MFLHVSAYSRTLIDAYAHVQYSSYLSKASALVLERFSFEYRKTKTKVITLANHKGHRQNSEPIKTRSNYM